MATALDKESISIFEKLLREQLPTELKLVVQLAVQEKVQDFFEERKKVEVQNPLLRIIHDLTEEALNENLRELVVGVITDQVDDHLMNMRCRVAFDVICSELVHETVNNDFEEVYNDIEIELTRESILNECINELIGEFVNVIVDEIKEDLLEAHSSREKRAVENQLKEVVASRLLLTHLMNSISENFATVQMEYYSKALVQRMMASRLLSLMNEIEGEIGGLVKNDILKYAFSQFGHELMQEALIREIQDMSEVLMEDIDSKEQARLAIQYQQEGRSHKLAYAPYTLIPDDLKENKSEKVTKKEEEEEEDG